MHTPPHLFRIRLSLTCATGGVPSQPPPRRAHREHVSLVLPLHRRPTMWRYLHLPGPLPEVPHCNLRVLCEPFYLPFSNQESGFPAFRTASQVLQDPPVIGQAYTGPAESLFLATGSYPDTPLFFSISPFLSLFLLDFSQCLLVIPVSPLFLPIYPCLSLFLHYFSQCLLVSPRFLPVSPQFS